MIDKRQTPRIETDLGLISRPSNLDMDSHITNMSAKGAFIENSESLPVNEELNLHFQLPDDPDVMTADARVVWNNSGRSTAANGVGIEFTNMLPKQQQKLNNFIEHNLQQDNNNMDGIGYV